MIKYKKGKERTKHETKQIQSTKYICNTFARITGIEQDRCKNVWRFWAISDILKLYVHLIRATPSNSYIEMATEGSNSQKCLKREDRHIEQNKYVIFHITFLDIYIKPSKVSQGYCYSV